MTFCGNDIKPKKIIMVTRLNGCFFNYYSTIVSKHKQQTKTY